MYKSAESSTAKVETTLYGKFGNPLKERLIINSHPDPLYDAVMALTLSKDEKHYAYSAVDKNELFPVVDGRPQEFHLKVDASCCGENGEWYGVWEYTEYTFSSDGKRIAFLEVNEFDMRLILDGKVIDHSPVVGDLRFSPNGKFLAYFTRDSKLGSDSKKIFLSINGKRLWTFDPAHSPGERENIKIQSLNNDSGEAVGYNSGKPVRVTCKLEDRGQ
jgi:WD40-like Beta Propeller Repeat